ncbi:MAG: hypothetical protein CM15mP38_0170 [Synechococcus sp.]|nr:MAG: hypothetical protein CM15mP38_0170 [Synechococcus sp.]
MRPVLKDGRWWSISIQARDGSSPRYRHLPKSTSAWETGASTRCTRAPKKGRPMRGGLFWQKLPFGNEATKGRIVWPRTGTLKAGLPLGPGGTDLPMSHCSSEVQLRSSWGGSKGLAKRAPGTPRWLRLGTVPARINVRNGLGLRKKKPSLRCPLSKSKDHGPPFFKKVWEPSRFGGIIRPNFFFKGTLRRVTCLASPGFFWLMSPSPNPHPCNAGEPIRSLKGTSVVGEPEAVAIHEFLGLDGCPPLREPGDAFNFISR